MRIKSLYFITVGVALSFNYLPTTSQTITKDVPGVVINHLPADSAKYVGSPSICTMPNGDYIASHDIFGKEIDQSEQGTLIFISKDKGITWRNVAKLNQFWSKLFYHRGAVYLIGPGTGTATGYLVVRKSYDGIHWPNKQGAGKILKGDFHTAPTPVIIGNGRIWKAVECVSTDIKGWPKKYGLAILSAKDTADLTKPQNWLLSNALYYDSVANDTSKIGWLEGNAVFNSNGDVLNIARVHTLDKNMELAAIARVSNQGSLLTFDAETGFVEFPGGSKKFTVRYDSLSSKYLSLTNYIPPAHRKGDETRPSVIRNTLALISSDDLINWTVNQIVLYHDDTKRHGFQYVDWQFEGNDIIFVSRTSYDDNRGGAKNFHDANFLTFHRLGEFRKYLGRTTE